MPKDVQVAITDLEREQDVEPSQRHSAVDVEEIYGQHRGGLRTQEPSPAGVGLPGRCRWDAAVAQDPANG
jgi:hypothetical protein